MAIDRRIWRQQEPGRLKGPQFGEEYPTSLTPDFNRSMVYLGQNADGTHFAISQSQFSWLLDRCVWLSNGHESAVFLEIKGVGHDDPDGDSKCLRFLTTGTTISEEIFLKTKTREISCKRLGIGMDSGLENFAVLHRVKELEESGLFGRMNEEKLKDLISNFNLSTSKWVNSDRIRSR